jgi:hypothetical protein
MFTLLISHKLDGDPMRHTYYRGLAATAMFLLASCDSPDAAPTESEVVRPGIWAAKGGPPPQDSVRLEMTVNDDAAFQVRSDSLGKYSDGVSGMRVIIDVPGNLQITPMNANSSTPPDRRLDVRYPPERTDLVHTFPDQWNFKILSNRVNNGNPRLQDMSVGASLCYNVTIAHRTQQVSYANSFNVALDAGASYALITRTSAVTWSVTSGGVASTGLDCGVDNISHMTGSDLTVKHGGDFTVGPMPLAFSITLEAKP